MSVGTRTQETREDHSRSDSCGFEKQKVISCRGTREKERKTAVPAVAASSEPPVCVRRPGPPPTSMKEGEGRAPTEGSRNALSRQESALLCSACSYSPVISKCVQLWLAPVPVGGRRSRGSGAQGGRLKIQEKKSAYQKTNFWAMTPCKLVRNFFFSLRTLCLFVLLLCVNGGKAQCLFFPSSKHNDLQNASHQRIH